MQKPSYDPGLTNQYGGNLKRTLNAAGDFNVRRVGSTWRDAHPYLFLINASWRVFLAIVTVTFIVVNTLFALLYFAIGIEHLKGADAPTAALRFLNAFFSAHTLTTVGYGNMWPVGPLANTIAASEALVGVLAFAIATGLLFGRFSRPSARIGFSESAIIAPYQDVTSFQFRVTNRRSNNLIDVNARVMLMTVDPDDGELRRQFTLLTLEREAIIFFPLTWTVVHPITATSPLWGVTPKQLESRQAEFLIMIRAYDDSFGQNVQARYSYRYDQLIWGARFNPAFEVTGEGDLELDVGRVGEWRSAELPKALVEDGGGDQAAFG